MSPRFWKQFGNMRQNSEKIKTTWKHIFVAEVMPGLNWNRSCMVEGHEY